MRAGMRGKRMGDSVTQGKGGRCSLAFFGDSQGLSETMEKTSVHQNR